MGTSRAYCIPHPLFGTHFLPKNHATPLIRNTTRFAKKKVETFSVRQTANRSVQLRVCSFAGLAEFQILATRSVQFSSFLFRQNIIQYKNAYRNCKVAREPRSNQKAKKPGLPSLKQISKIK